MNHVVARLFGDSELLLPGVDLAQVLGQDRLHLDTIKGQRSLVGANDQVRVDQEVSLASDILSEIEFNAEQTDMNDQIADLLVASEVVLEGAAQVEVDVDVSRGVVVGVGRFVLPGEFSKLGSFKLGGRVLGQVGEQFDPTPEQSGSQSELQDHAGSQPVQSGLAIVLGVERENTDGPLGRSHGPGHLLLGEQTSTLIKANSTVLVLFKLHFHNKLLSTWKSSVHFNIRECQNRFQSWLKPGSSRTEFVETKESADGKCPTLTMKPESGHVMKQQSA